MPYGGPPAPLAPRARLLLILHRVDNPHAQSQVAPPAAGGLPMLRTLLTLPAVLTLALGLHVATPALAQTDVQRLRDAIEVTDRRIELATELITASPNPRARAELDQAIALQALAK